MKKIIGAVTPFFMAAAIFFITFSSVSVLTATGNSNYPTIKDGSFEIAEKFGTTFVKRGKFVIFDYNDSIYSKRVIGLPGETIEIVNSVIYINGSPLNEDYIFLSSDNMIPSQKNMAAITLKDNEYFLLGDNRCTSADSRTFGPVDGNNILGTVLNFH